MEMATGYNRNVNVIPAWYGEFAGADGQCVHEDAYVNGWVATSTRTM